MRVRLVYTDNSWEEVDIADPTRIFFNDSIVRITGTGRVVFAPLINLKTVRYSNEG